MRALFVAIVIAGCAVEESSATEGAPLDRYVADSAFRRTSLESSLVTKDNAYAQLRLANYDESHWGALPELNPETTPLTVDSARAASPAGASPAADAAWQTIDTSDEDLVALGKRAFFNYPVQIIPTLPKAVASEDRAGMWQSDGRTGAVWAKFPGGLVSAFTCSTCHASLVGDRLVAGRNNPDVDIARMAGDGRTVPSWPRGTVDVTADGVEDPIAITDLRPIRFQKNLHHAATLRNDPAALAVRIETLIITSLNQSVRPPRKIVAGLTAYLLSLSASVDDGSVDDGPGAPGRDVFMKTCAGCHQGQEAAGTPVPLAKVGTNPLVGESRDRGTGMYRVPSLHFVGDRHRLFASGAVEDIDELLTPSASRNAKGHLFGLSLSDADRAALLEYLRSL